MPNETLEEALREAYASASTEPVLDTLEISFPGTLPRGVEFVEDWTYEEQGTINWQGGNADGTVEGVPPFAIRSYSIEQLQDGAVVAPRWSLVNNNPLGLRWDYEDDENCAAGQTEAFAYWNPYTQTGYARCKVRILSEQYRRMLITWEGMGERQSSSFESMTFRYKKESASSFTTAGTAHAPGGGLGCVGGMGPVVSDPTPPVFIDLEVGEVYDIEIQTSSNDSLYHNGAYYQFTLAFFDTDTETDELLDPPPFIEGIAGLPPVYLVRDRQEQEFTLEDGVTVTFEPCAFRLVLPSTGGEGLQSIRVSIDNVDQRITQFLNSVKGLEAPVLLTYRPFLVSDRTKPQIDPPLKLTLTDVQVTATEVVGAARFADVVNSRFLTQRYTRERFRSLGI